MNQEQQLQEKSTTDSGKQKKRNPLERLLVWGGIIALLVVVFIEYRAKQSYDTTVSALQDVANGMRDVTIDEARQLMVGYSQVEGPHPNPQGLNTYHYKWFSLFKGGTYQITLVENDNHMLKTFTGPAFAVDPDELAAKIKEANSDDVELTPPIIGNVTPDNPNEEKATEKAASEKETSQQE